MREVVFLILFVLIIAAAAQFLALKEGKTMLSGAGYLSPAGTVSVVLEKGMTREAIAALVGEALGFDEKRIQQFHATYRSMQWMAVSDVLIPHLVEAYDLSEADREILLTHANVYLDREEDVLESLYLSQEYELRSDATVVEAAEVFITPLREKRELVPELIEEARVEELLAYVKDADELLPDLVPLPPQDVEARKEGARTLLVFTTVYYNQGTGPLELRADPSTVGVIGDFDRTVFQRIYKKDGSYRERTAGTFTWHNEHLHYHFIDFIEYRLASLDNSEGVSEKLSEKSTFCIRDVSRVHLGVEAGEAEYRICGRERQGVSVGWGDAYFNSYVDQNLDITDLPSGTYRLTFIANPEDRFDEVTKENNTSYTDIYYDAEAQAVRVLSHEPGELPEFEHIHVEQEL